MLSVFYPVISRSIKSRRKITIFHLPRSTFAVNTYRSLFSSRSIVTFSTYHEVRFFKRNGKLFVRILPNEIRDKWFTQERAHKREVKKATAATRQAVMATGNKNNIPQSEPEIEKTLSVIEEEISPIVCSNDSDKITAFQPSLTNPPALNQMFPEDQSSQGEVQVLPKKISRMSEASLNVDFVKMSTWGARTQSGELEERGGPIPGTLRVPSSCSSAKREGWQGPRQAVFWNSDKNAPKPVVLQPGQQRPFHVGSDNQVRRQPLKKIQRGDNLYKKKTNLIK